MNKIIISIIAFVSILAISCNNTIKKENEALKAEIAMLSEQNTMLAKGVFEEEITIENYQAMLKEIDQQLASIDEKHNLIKTKGLEYKNDAQVEEEILLHIGNLHHQLENTKHKISHLHKNMENLRKGKDADHEQMHKMDLYINDLANLVVKRDMQINALHATLDAQGINISAISKAYAEQAMYSEVLLDILNSGFYVAATKKELEEMGILDMKGGFIGIGRVKTLNANAPVQFLVPIDIRDTELIELYGKKAELITPHPIDSYELTFNNDDKTTFLGIANKLKFWQETNYLVVEIAN